MAKEEELNYLKDQAQAIKEDLERINSRLRDLESKK
jgi:prefoldin subunit 5